MYNVAIVLIIACKVISGKCIHTIYHSTRLAPQCHAFHLVGLKAWQFVWLRVEITTIVAYAMLVLLRIIFIITTIVPYAGKRVNSYVCILCTILVNVIDDI